MAVSITAPTSAQAPAPIERQVICLEIEPGLVCLRGLSPQRLRFEVEYGLERGTTANSFLLEGGMGSGGQLVPPVLVHPPGASFAAAFLEQLRRLVPADAALKVVVGHVNPNRVALLRQLAEGWPQLMLVASNTGAKLLAELWQQRKPVPPAQSSTPSSGAPSSNAPSSNAPSISASSTGTTASNSPATGAESGGDGSPAEAPIPALPPIDVVKQEVSRKLANGYQLRLIPTPTPRWPGALVAFEERTGLLLSGKFFAAHLCTESWAEANRSSTEEDRRYFYDCLMAPMARQVESVVERLEELDIRCIAPGHGPAIAESWRSLLVDYRRWGEPQERSRLAVALLYASAYGNTAAIADALAQGVARTGVRV